VNILSTKIIAVESDFLEFENVKMICFLKLATVWTLHCRVPAKFSLTQHGKPWPTGILVRRPWRLELTARTSATNYFNQPFQALSENVFIQADMAFSALETFCLIGYISLLTYLITIGWSVASESAVS